MQDWRADGARRSDVNTMNAAQLLALTNRAYACIGSCSCPLESTLCERCEVFRDMITALNGAYPDLT